MGFSLLTFNTRDFFDDEPPFVISNLDKGGFTGKRRRRARHLFEAKLDAITQVIHDCDADVLCLQEVGGPRALERLAERLDKLRLGYAHCLLGPETDSRGICVALLSRFPLRESSAEEARDGVDRSCPIPALDEGQPLLGFVDMRRGMIDVIVDVPQVRTGMPHAGEPAQPVNVIVVHLKSHNPMIFGIPRLQSDLSLGVYRSALYRMAEAQFLRQLLDRRLLQNSRSRVVVAGDFNEHVHSVVMRMICGSEIERGRRGLETHAFRSCCLSVPEEDRYSLIYRGKRFLFDNVLVSPALWEQFKETKILNERLVDISRAIAKGGPLVPDSDHAAVKCSFG